VRVSQHQPHDRGVGEYFEIAHLFPFGFCNWPKDVQFLLRRSGKWNKDGVQNSYELRVAGKMNR
jgi:hypothetical protein